MLTGPNNGSIFANDNSIGTEPWNDPINAQFSDNVYANTGVMDEISNYLTVTGFEFSIPSNATILGVIAEVERYGAMGAVIDSVVKLIKGGVISGDNKADIINFWPTSDAYKTYGDSNDLWGLTLTPVDINLNDFGFAIAGYSGFDLLNIDHVRLSISYEVVSGWAQKILSIVSPNKINGVTNTAISKINGV